MKPKPEGESDDVEQSIRNTRRTYSATGQTG
jgi:hypothetical protein